MGGGGGSPGNRAESIIIVFSRFLTIGKYKVVGSAFFPVIFGCYQRPSVLSSDGSLSSLLSSASSASDNILPNSSSISA